MTNYRLKGKIIEKYGTIGRFCSSCNISKSLAMRTLRRERTVSEIEKCGWALLLDIPRSEIRFFFDNIDEKTQLGE